MPTTKAYAAMSPSTPLVYHPIERRDVGEKDVRIDVAFCGICHTDIHQTRDEWGAGTFPMVPGHEIVGTISKVGKKVRGFKVGDAAGVGCMVGSCGKCPECRRGLEQHCRVHTSFTYNNTEQDGKTPTQGGYSASIVVDESFALKIAPKQPLERVAPLLCAGITTYSPLKRFKIGKGKRLGVLGLGGLGHMAVKLGAAMGAEVTVLSTSPSKARDAKRLGAHEFVLTSDAAAAARLEGRLDAIIDTVSADHDLAGPLSWLAFEGTLIMVGVPPKPLAVPAMPLIAGRRAVAGSVIGGIAETQEMLDFCAKKKVLADVEVCRIQDVNAAYARMLKNDVRYRFSIDLSSL